MTPIDNLPLDWFPAAQGVSLTDAEMHEALQDFLTKKCVAGTVAGLNQMAKDDTVVALHLAVEHPAAV